MQGKLIALLCVVSALSLAACAENWIVTYDGQDSRGDREILHSTLTPDGTDSYTYRNFGSGVHVAAAPSNTRGNYRAVFWPRRSPSVTDGQSCATWSAQPEKGNTQQGAALRITTNSTGVSRAITVTKNIMFGATWMFNVHVWDTSKRPANTGIGSADMRSVVRGKPLPWHLCARTRNNLLEMKVWTGSEPEPPWEDGSHTRSFRLASDWVYPGRTGWYIGHVPPGGSAGFTNLKTWRLGRQISGPES